MNLLAQRTVYTQYPPQTVQLTVRDICAAVSMTDLAWCAFVVVLAGVGTLHAPWWLALIGHAIIAFEFYLLGLLSWKRAVLALLDLYPALHVVVPVSLWPVPIRVSFEVSVIRHDVWTAALCDLPLPPARMDDAHG